MKKNLSKVKKTGKSSQQNKSLYSCCMVSDCEFECNLIDIYEKFSFNEKIELMNNGKNPLSLKFDFINKDDNIIKFDCCNIETTKKIKSKEKFDIEIDIIFPNNITPGNYCVVGKLCIEEDKTIYDGFSFFVKVNDIGNSKKNLNLAKKNFIKNNPYNTIFPDKTLLNTVNNNSLSENSIDDEQKITENKNDENEIKKDGDNISQPFKIQDSNYSLDSQGDVKYNNENISQSKPIEKEDYTQSSNKKETIITDCNTKGDNTKKEQNKNLEKEEINNEEKKNNSEFIQQLKTENSQYKLQIQELQEKCNNLSEKVKLLQEQQGEIKIEEKKRNKEIKIKNQLLITNIDKLEFKKTKSKNNINTPQLKIENTIQQVINFNVPNTCKKYNDLTKERNKALNKKTSNCIIVQGLQLSLLNQEKTLFNAFTDSNINCFRDNEPSQIQYKKKNKLTKEEIKKKFDELEQKYNITSIFEISSIEQAIIESNGEKEKIQVLLFK